MGFLGRSIGPSTGRPRSSTVFVAPRLVVYTNWKDGRTPGAVKIEPQSRPAFARTASFALPAAPSLGQELAHILQQLRRRIADAVDRAQNSIASDRAYVDPELGGIFQVLRILMHRQKRALQRLGAIPRQVRRRGEGPRHRIRQLSKLDQRARRLVLREFARGRHVRKIGMPGRAREL